MGLESVHQEYVRLEENPFSSEQKWMAVRCVHRTQQVRIRPPFRLESVSCILLVLTLFPSQDKTGVYFVKGAYEQVIRFCSSYNSRGAALPLNHQQRELYQQQISYMGTSGLRGNGRGPFAELVSLQLRSDLRFLSPSSGLRLGVTDGEPDLPGSGGHHRPSQGRRQRGRRYAHQLWGGHQDDHRRLPGDSRVYRSESLCCSTF